jgi:hypothetical protein
VDTSIDLTDEEWIEAREVWLETGRTSAVAEALGMVAHVAERLVEEGARGRPPLRLEAREQAAIVEARASSVEASKPSAVVVADARESRTEELRLVRSNRRSALVLANLNVRLLRTADALSESLMKDLVDANGRPTEMAGRLSPKERVGLIRTVAQIVQRAAEASSKSVQMERLLMGEPTAILGHQDVPSTDGMTPEEAEQWISTAHRALERRMRRRTVIDVTSTVDDPQSIDIEEP